MVLGNTVDGEGIQGERTMVRRRNAGGMQKECRKATGGKGMQKERRTECRRNAGESIIQNYNTKCYSGKGNAAGMQGLFIV